MTGALLDWVLNGARKATGAFVLGAAGAFGAAMLDGALTGGEAVTAIGTGLLAAGAAFGLENTGERAPDTGGQHRAES